MKRHSIAAIMAAVALAACAPKPVVKKSALGAGASASAAGGTAVDAPEADVRNSLLHSIADVQDVRFDFNSDALTPEARQTLKRNAEWLKSHADVKAQVAGHCDQRGTVEYNLALGQRRAAAARRYYILLGVDGGRIATISYGKEKPVCEAAQESCWRLNRRAQTLVAFSQDLSRAR